MNKTRSGLPQLKGLKKKRSQSQQFKALAIKPRKAEAPSASLSQLANAQINMANTEQAIRQEGGNVKEAEDDRNFLEKTLNLRQGQGFFGDVFEVLNRPANAVRGALIDKNPFEGMYKGVRGQEEYSGDKLLTEMGILNEDSPQWLKAVGGFAADVATDPLSYSTKPFQIAGKWIKKGGQAGLKAGKSALEMSEKGQKLLKNIENAYERIASVSKSSFNLWKDTKFKDYKGSALNRANANITSMEHAGDVMKDIAKEREVFITNIVKNPNSKENKEVLSALGLSSVEPKYENVARAIDEDAFKALEMNRNTSLSKKDVYDRLGAQYNETGGGRFFIAAEGEEANAQAQAIMKEVKDDWKMDNGRPLAESDLTYNAETGFIDVSPEVAAFLRRSSSHIDTITQRRSLFGSIGEIEGAVNTLSKTGKITLDMHSAADRELFNVINRELGNAVEGRIAAGAGTKALTLTPDEIKKVMGSKDIEMILRESKEFAKEGRKIEMLNTRIVELEAQIGATQAPALERLDKITAEVSNLMKKREAVLNKHFKVSKKSRGAQATNTEKKLTDREIKEVNKQLEKLDKEFSKQAIKMDKELSRIQGRKLSMEESAKEAQRSIKLKENTIKKVVKETDLKLSKETTNAELAQEFNKAPENKVTLVSNTEKGKAIQTYASEIKRVKAFNEGNFYKVKFSEPVLLNVSDNFKNYVDALEGLKVKMYEQQRAIHAGSENVISLIDSLDVDGYMRHVANPDTMVYNDLKRLKDGKTLKDASQRREVISRLGKNAKFYQQNWLGGAVDINKKLGIELFNTNPIESIAVAFKLVPEHFEATRLFNAAWEENLIRTISEEEANVMVNMVEEQRKLGMPLDEAKRIAARKTLPKEYTLLSHNDKIKLTQSFEFLKNAGAENTEVAALQEQINKIDEAQDIVMHKGVINQISRYGKKIGNEDVQAILSTMNRYFIQPFKSIATLSVGFHVRNNITNLTNAYLAGISPGTFMKHFSTATRDVTSIERKLMPKLSKMMAKGGAEVRTVEGQLNLIEKTFTVEEKQLLNKMMEWQSKGVLGANRYTNDMDTIMRKATGKTPFESIKAVTQASMKLGKISDDASKIAAYEFAKNTKKGKELLAMHGMKNPEEFSRFVFFDYTDLSPFESKYMRALFPFYTWTRKNVEFQIKNFMKQPNRYIRLQKALKASQQAFTSEDSELSQWDREDMLVPVWKKDGKITMLKVSPGFINLEELYHNPLTNLSPLIKAPLEVAVGKNLFTGKETTSSIFGQLSNEMFGDFGELGKALTGKDFDKSKMGLVGSKVVGMAGAMGSVLDGKPTASSLMPSVFRETDTETNKARDIEDRLRRARAYLSQIRGEKTDSYKGIRKRRT